MACNCTCPDLGFEIVIQDIFQYTGNASTDEDVAPADDEEKFDYMGTMMKVMLPSLCSFFILTAGFYVLHGYTSLKSVIKVQTDDGLGGPAAVPYKDYANQTPEKAENNNDCRTESQAKRNPVTTIMEENESQFTSACPTDQREDTFYKATTLQHVK